MRLTFNSILVVNLNANPIWTNNVLLDRFHGDNCAINCLIRGGGGGANTKVTDMYGVGWVFSGPKTQK